MFPVVSIEVTKTDSAVLLNLNGISQVGDGVGVFVAVELGVLLGVLVGVCDGV